MQQDILEAMKCRDETIEALGQKLLVREMPAAANLGFRNEAEAAEHAEDIFYLMVVRSTFYAEGERAGEQVFTDEDVAAIKAGSKKNLSALLGAVTRVNGLDTDDNAKK